MARKPLIHAEFDWENYRAAQSPVEMPTTPRVICGTCKVVAMCRVAYDGDLSLYTIAVACPRCGEIQSVSLNAVTIGQHDSKPLLFSLIENLKTVFESKE